MKTKSERVTDILAPRRSVRMAWIDWLVLGALCMLVAAGLLGMLTGCESMPAPKLEQVLWSVDTDVEIVTDQGNLHLATWYIATYDPETEETVQCPLIMLSNSIYIPFGVKGVPPDPADILPDICVQTYGEASFGSRPEKEPGRD